MPNRFAEAIRVVVETAERGAFRVALIGGFALPFFGVRRATGDVDFLAEASGSDPLHDALLGAGQTCLQRTREVANYESARPSAIASVDLLFASRPRAIAMLGRARKWPLSGSGLHVPVVDAEGLVGLKVQGAATNPDRALRDRDDIRQLVARHGTALDIDLLRDYYRLFDLEAELDDLLRDLGIATRRT
jgi:hypothetical protein